MDNPSIVSHLSVGTNDFDAATTFYDTVLATIGVKKLLNFPGAVAYGKLYPEFWVQTPIDGQPASCANGFHVGFIAANREEVQAFWEAALAAGATGDGEPGERPHYGPQYYGCFVRDLDGHKIECTWWNAAATPPPGQ